MNIDDSPRTPFRHLKLPTWGRVGTLVSGLLFLAAAAGYTYARPLALVAVDGCTAKPSSCSVLVTSLPDSAVTVALLLVAAYSLLSALTGLVWTISVGGSGTAPVQEPHVENISDDPALVPNGIEVSKSGTDTGVRLSPKDSKELFASLPNVIRDAMQDRWHDLHPDRRAELDLQEIRRPGEGRKGNWAYYLRLRSQKSGEDTWFRVGQGRGGASASEAEPDN